MNRKVYLITVVFVSPLSTLLRSWDIFWQVFSDFRSLDTMIWYQPALLAAKLTEGNTKLALYEASIQKRKFRYPVLVNTNPEK